MIRIGLPPSMLPLLRLRGPITPSWRLRQKRALQEYVNRTAAVPYAWWKQAAAWMTTHLSLRARALERRRAQLAGFEQRYEDLIDLLCSAAKDGDSTSRDRRYAELRGWLCRHYGRLRPYLRPYFTSEQSGSVDPFEALLAPECVEKVIHAEMGVEEIMRTRAALDAYRDSLSPRRETSR